MSKKTLWKILFFEHRIPIEYNYVRIWGRKLKKKRVLAWSPNKKRLQLDLTSFCNLSCLNCDRSMGRAPSGEYVKLEQIKKLIKESIELNWKWETIHLIGGEPTLHPDFFNVLDLMKEYKNFNSKCSVVLSTNGFGPKVNEILSKLPSWVKVINSSKESNVHPFESYNIAPIDLEEFKNSDFKKGCWITEDCGICLTNNGFYPCGAGAAVDRVFGFDMGIKELSSVKKSNLRKQMKSLCKYCGHFKSGHFSKSDRIFDQQESDSWKKAYKNYNEKKPELTKY